MKSIQEVLNAAVEKQVEDKLDSMLSTIHDKTAHFVDFTLEDLSEKLNELINSLEMEGNSNSIKHSVKSLLGRGKMDNMLKDHIRDSVEKRVIDNIIKNLSYETE